MGIRKFLVRAPMLLASLALVLIVAACGGASGGDQGGGGGENQGPFTIGVSNGFVGSEWRTQMIEDLEMVNERYRKEGVTEDLVVESADVDVQGQIQQMRNLINRGVDAIIINPNDVSALNQVIGEASDAGIPVISVDQEIGAEGATNVVIDQGEWARRSAEWLVEEMGGKGNIVVINGIAGHPANEARYDAVKEVFEQNPGINVVREANANWDQATAQQEMSNIISSGTDYDAVWTQDGMAQGVLQAIQESNPDQYPTVSGEARAGYMRLWDEVRQEHSEFSSYGVVNPPGIAASGLRVAVEMLEGKEIAQDQLQGEAGNTLYVPIPDTVDDANLEKQLQSIDGKPDSYALDGIISEEQAEAFFE